jgi:hypothetical protein
MRMIRSRLPAIILILAAAAPPALADTYKWVDEKGVVNYSNKPPPAAAAKQTLVAERVSVIAPDPSIGPAIAAMEARAARRAQYEEADFLQRQRYMLAAQASYGDSSCAYGSDCGMGYDAAYYYPYGYPGVFSAHSVRRFAPGVAHHHHRASFASGGRGGMRGGRGRGR